MSSPDTELVPSSSSHELVLPQDIGKAGHCANCGATLTDDFCAHCGQRREHQVHSLAEFLGEAAEVITHADSRVWRTFVPLLFRPGFLTQQYLAGRRASYLPPFRLYIVLSVVFFLVVSMASHSTRVGMEAPSQARTELQKQLDASTDPVEQSVLRKTIQGLKAVDVKSDATSVGNCETNIPSASLPNWLRARIVTGCQKIAADNGRELFQSMIHNAGRAMFVFLPLIAALMKLLYWHPRRYYVEHLLLLLHNHAFIFIAVSLLLILQMIVPSDLLMGWVSTALWLYILWYLYRSMRRVYGQSRTQTAFKFALLFSAYCICGLLTFVLAMVYSAFTL